MEVDARAQEWLASGARVKVYRMGAEDSGWEEDGTGQAWCAWGAGGALEVRVEDEEDTARLLLEHHVSPAFEYTRQEDSIITCYDPRAMSDLALSFQDVEGCQWVWQALVEAVPDNVITEAERLEQEREMDKIEADMAEEMGNTMDLDTEVLADPTAENLSKIYDQIAAVTYFKEPLTEKLLQQDCAYLEKLFDLFHEFEGNRAKSLDRLRMLFLIFKELMLNGEDNLVSTLLSDRFFIEVISCLEYNPEKAHGAHFYTHREHVRDACFHEVCPIPSIEVVGMIHQNYRINYVLNGILLKYTDVGFVQNSLKGLQFHNNVQILTWFSSKPNYFCRVFEKMASLGVDPGESDSSKAVKLCLGFLEEVCTMAKSVSMQRIFDTLVDAGLYDAIKSLLKRWSDPSHHIILHRLAVIITIVMGAQEEGICSTLLNPNAFHDLMEPMIRLATCTNEKHESSVVGMYSEIIQRVLAFHIMSQTPQRSKLTAFYRTYFGLLVKAATRTDYPFAQQNTIDILITTMRDHSQWLNCVVEEHHVLYTIVPTIAHKSSVASKLAIMRFLKFCITYNQDWAVKEIEQHRLLDPIIAIFIENGSKYNLLHSSMMELFHSILVDDMTSLLHYIGTYHLDRLETIECGPLFHRMRDRVDQDKADSIHEREEEELSVFYGTGEDGLMDDEVELGPAVHDSPSTKRKTPERSSGRFERPKRGRAV